MMTIIETQQSLKINKSVNFSISGFSLVEMMISMILGLVLVSGILMMYLNVKDSGRSRDSVSAMEANARMAFTALRQGIQHAGYRSIYNLGFEEPFVTDSIPVLANKSCRTKGELYAISNYATVKSYLEVTKDKNAGDRITIAYLADNPADDNARLFRDSLGASIENDDDVGCSADRENGIWSPSEGRIYTTYYISQKTLLTFGSRSSSPQPVAENIQNMQIVYGVTRDGNTVFKNATEVELNNEWLNVTSVRVALLVRSEEDVLDAKEEKTYSLLDSDVTVRSRRLMRVYTTTINLPNRNARNFLG